MAAYRALRASDAPDLSSDHDPDSFKWTGSKVVLSIFLFFLAGLAEIGGGWLVWQAVRVRGREVQWWRDTRALAYVGAGGCALVAYGFIPTAQPPPTFGRLYAVYGGMRRARARSTGPSPLWIWPVSSPLCVCRAVRAAVLPLGLGSGW